MATDLTGFSLSEVYTTFLHTSGGPLSAGVLQRVFNGVGEQTPLRVAVSSIAIDGNFTCNSVQYPVTPGAINTIPVMGNNNTLEFKTLQNVLTSTQVTPVQDGVYSSPRIAFVDGLVSSVQNTGATKIFFIGSRTTLQSGPSLADLRNAIVWNSQPTAGDVAFVMQKVMTRTGSTMSDIDVHRFEFENTSGWSLYTKF